MKKIMLLLFILLLVFSQGLFAQTENGAGLNLIRTQGEAEVFGQNDSVRISISIITENKDLDAATSESANKTNLVLIALKKMIIKNLSLETTNYQVLPKKKYAKDTPPTIVGYEVQNTIEAKIEKLDPKHLSEYSSRIMGSAIDNGANRVTDMQFYIKDIETLENNALAEATRKAKTRAEVVAASAGVQIKKIVTIDTQPATPAPRPMMMRTSAMKTNEAVSAPPIEIGDSSVRMQVQMSFEIE